MKLIKEIYQNEIGESNKDSICYKIRKASRAIVYNNDRKIALLFVSRDNYHKLPGGGIEKGEDIKIALNREILEEVGAEINVLDEIGATIEYRDEFEQLQISYCYEANQKGDLTDANFTEKEKNSGFKIKWVNLDEAIKLLEKDKPVNYVGKFIRHRDLLFLKEVINKNV
ncbi:NUDIX domain-containing protein [Candidatus Falkowbacteria bacterium]|jgi:8-oxo-dGTP diphosphatase|nr:NUDIX domain-containing protein [Candidatus Falkowbacteria bacterium]MBT4433109.1 NUDIX domain-containing protein [Candidatus Falkowbacteria bacterium]